MIYLRADRDERGELCAHALHAVLQRAVAHDPAVLNVDTACKGYLRDAEIRRRCGACLGGVAIDRVAAEQQQVKIAYLLRGLGKGVGRGESVRAAEGAVREQVRLVAAEGESLFQHLFRLRGAHADRNDCRAVLLLELDGGLDRVRVERIYHALHALAAQVPGLGIELDVVRVRHLFDKNKYFHVL